jgi:hypothetical protein
MGSKLRNKAIATLAMVSGISFSSVSFAESQGFTDIDSSNSYAPYIQDLQDIGAIKGTENGNFNPTGSITRAEFVKLLVASFQLPLDTSHFHFEDLSGHWAATYIQTAWSKGIVSGVSDYRFAPDASIKREEAATIVWRYLKDNGIKASVQNFMLPNTVDSWASEGVAQAMAKKLFGIPFTKGNYQDSMIREEAAALIDLAVKQVKAIQNTAKTPDGKNVYEGQQEPAHLKDIDLTMQHQVDATDHISFPNHSSLISQEEVTIPAGKATLVKLSHDNFTAASEQEKVPGKTDIIYWLYLNQPIPNDSTQMNTYILSAVVTGDDTAAKSEILEVAKIWSIPTNK